MLQGLARYVVSPCLHDRTSRRSVRAQAASVRLLTARAMQASGTSPTTPFSAAQGGVPWSGGLGGLASVSVAGCELGCGDGVAFGVEGGRGVLCEVAAVCGLAFVVEVSEDRCDEADGGCLVGEDPHDA